jgi:hypothetical protein
MKKLIAVLVLAAAVSLGGFGWWWFTYGKEIAAIKGVNRSGQVLLTNNRSDNGDWPFLLNVTITSETSDQIIFDVEYFMSDTITGEYSISIHPNTSDWSYPNARLRPGRNKEKFSVSYAPQPASKWRSDSQLLHIYINHFENNEYKEKVFDRTVDFPKTWMH